MCVRLFRLWHTDVFSLCVFVDAHARKFFLASCVAQIVIVIFVGFASVFIWHVCVSVVDVRLFASLLKPCNVQGQFRTQDVLHHLV